MVTKITKKLNKKTNQTEISINVNGKKMVITVLDDEGTERVLLHGHMMTMPLNIGYATQIKITKTDEYGRIQQLSSTHVFNEV